MTSCLINTSVVLSFQSLSLWLHAYTGSTTDRASRGSSTDKGSTVIFEFITQQQHIDCVGHEVFIKNSKLSL